MKKNALLPALALFLQSCNSGGTGKDWVNSGASVKQQLKPDGVLHIDKRFHDVVRLNYRAFLYDLARVYRDKRLFNQTPTPMVVYFMFDAADYAKYGGAGHDPLGSYVPEEQCIYIHGNGRQLVERGQTRRLIREVARNVMHDVYGGSNFPAWLEVGVTQFLSDGNIGKTDQKAKDGFDFDWFAGVPDPDVWSESLDGDLPTFETVRTASAQQMRELGAPGRLVATAAAYLLEQLDRLGNVIWQLQSLTTREPSDVLMVMKRNDPRYREHFEDPVAALFKLRPDIRVYLECAAAMAGPKTLARSGDNARSNSKVGSYWWQYAQLLLTAEKNDEAIVALEMCRKCKAHRDLEVALKALAGLYYERKKWTVLRAVVEQQLRESVLPTPTMHLMLAESLASTDKVAAIRNVELALALPRQGFEQHTARLEELRIQLAQ